MKKICKILLCFALSAITVLAAVGCNRGKQQSKEGTLNICVYAAGYGRDWIDEAVRLFLEDNEGIEVEIEANPLALGDTKTMLENNNCPYDIVLVGAQNYSTFVANGYITDLSDVYQMTVPDSGKKVNEVVEAGVIEKYTTGEGKIYGIPWQQNYPSGLVYNKKMFKQYGWDKLLPETMDEFWALCDKIGEDRSGAVTPVTYGGADGNGYLFNNWPQWLMECYGLEEYNKFLDLESPKAYEDQEEGRKKVYETMARFLKGKTKDGYDICLPGSEGATAITAQSNFVNGYTAMIVSGQFFVTEMAEYMALKNFEVGYIPMPHINSDKRSIDGTIDTSNVRLTTDNGVFAIPESSKNKDIAKKFLVHMLTGKSYTSFIKSTNGLLRALVNIDVDTSGFSEFAKTSYDYWYAGGNAQSSYKFSGNRMIENDKLSIFYAYEGGFFSRITAADSYEEALSIAQGCYANELGYVNARWDAGKKEWK